MSLRVVIEDLAASACAVGGYAEDLSVAQGAADDRLEAAQSGWQGRSATGLTALSTRWASQGRSAVARLADHAEALRDCARQFWVQDQDGADALNRLSDTGPRETGPAPG